MRKILPKSFFARPTLQVAQDLLGKFLVRKIPLSLAPQSEAKRGRGVAAPRGRGVLRREGEIAVMITEVEAYDGPKDKASHASRGMTERNAIMFGRGGYFYVYLCYGMYEMLNIVTGPKDYPAAILLRGAVSPLLSKEGFGGGFSPLLSKEGSGGGLDGPGKLTRFLKVDRRFNKKLAIKKTGLWFEDRGVKISGSTIRRTPRIGVAYAGPIWSKKLFRFLIDKAV
ncbi:MAG: DNA-3-methyladenine glycosylase [Patescibacteria group bacterium]|nr:DNA-3-methyladenine glycosylase [Patescibacteria group bacterium]